ncbi:MAG TPA: tetratricopeptide repeat protein [Candidatus Eisenbacteria bacterium]|nr:tetratricopeptide repeat protein [Candidatus Eisenbacteria bacterium]
MRGDAPKETALPVEEIIAKDPSSALYLPYAERLVEDGRLEEAIALCEERKRRPGRGVGDHIVLGRAYLADGQLGPARAEFKEALDLDRENVVALKALGGILAHEGNHTEAASYYQAVCRVDPGDLESQTALHQITSGEYPEIRPADVIVGQGAMSWQPVRLPREEEHLSELALGLRTIERFDASQTERTAPRPYTAPEGDFDLPVERNAPEEARAAIEPRDLTAPIAEHLALSDMAADAASESDADELSPEPAPAHAEAHVAAGPSGLGEIVESQPPIEVPRAPGKVVEGNKNAFETWIRQLGGKE